ncbi:NAD(P)-dependent oxidoreductase [Limnohabitans sp. T6-5]|uniref:SDR family oxidoreductase n=1 Tax=Limnohabitans sp. T6-5 TaxID=1100724 RepID=UPI000D35F05D|nr:SDR family oxidoreductase [Limnohabitans sp. T6-5]PUE11429.1 NAD(P)-dependent oxidoreductase [Limnohabitans sp. T6-5]
MPSNQTPLGALPARFRRQRVLIVGCGDVGLRTAGQLGAPQSQRVRLMALTSSPERVRLLRACGITPLLGDLDDPGSVKRLAGLAHRVLHLAPPASERQGDSERDLRSVALGRVLRLRTPPLALVYGSTTGVYGDCGGQRVSETRAVNPHTPRAQRRVDAEAAMRFLGRSGVRVSVLRIPGIYAPDREGGTPRGRLLKGTPVLVAKEDVYTNHIHANDLARACAAALWRGKAQRVVNVTDDTDLKMGDYFDLAADLYGLTRPPRLSRRDANAALPLMLLSFMNESRRLDNTRMKQELRLKLLYPHVRDGLSPQGALFSEG